MISALDAYRGTVGRSEPGVRVQTELTRLEAFINQAVRTGRYETSYDATTIGNPRVASPAGEIEEMALNSEQREFLNALKAAGYSITMDKTKKWVVSWANSEGLSDMWDTLSERIEELETGEFETLKFTTIFKTPGGSEFTEATGSGLLLGAGTQSQENLASTVAMPVNGTFYAGPTIDLGTEGTWFVVGHVTCRDTATDGIFVAKITDGTTDFTMGIANTVANQMITITLAAIVTDPAANLRISVANFGDGGASTTGQILGNSVSSGLESAITGFRVG